MKKLKRSKIIVTLVAATATALSLMSTALAAPATASSNCPTKNLLNNLISNNGASVPTTGSALPGNLQSLLGQTIPASLPTVPTATKCPKAQAAQQQLQQMFGQTIPASQPAVPTATKCPKAQAAQQQLGNLGNNGTAAPAATPAPAATTAPAPTAAPATGATTPVTGNMSADESKMISLVNQDRASNGLKPLTFDAGLRAGALAHSQDMADNNYFSHTSPTQGDFNTRIKAAGVQYNGAGENIAEYGSVESAETAFMNSPGHRANILGDYTRIGIGIVNHNGSYYITQWFAK